MADLSDDVVFDVLMGAYHQLLQQAAARFDVYGPRDQFGAGLWSAGCWIGEEYAKAMTGRDSVDAAAERATPRPPDQDDGDA